MQQWEYAVMEWLWDVNNLRVNLPGGAEEKLAGSYAEVVSTLTGLGREGWEVVGCVAAGNWLFWTLKRQTSGRNGFQYP
ncbi:MAG TPA: hypothetical protein VH540_15310 [Ktedonobacterales bacterium]|jgi:hypothetical protein